MATNHHGVGLQIVFQLLQGGANHIPTHFSIAQMAYFDIIAHGLEIQKVGNVEGDRLIGGAFQGYGIIPYQYSRRGRSLMRS